MLDTLIFCISTRSRTQASGNPKTSRRQPKSATNNQSTTMPIPEIRCKHKTCMVMTVHNRQRRLKTESHIAYISTIDTISSTNVCLRKMGDMEIAFLSNQLLLLLVGRPACRIARFPDDGSLLSLVSYVLKIAFFIQEDTSLISPRFHLCFEARCQRHGVLCLRRGGREGQGLPGSATENDTHGHTTQRRHSCIRDDSRQWQWEGLVVRTLLAACRLSSSASLLACGGRQSLWCVQLVETHVRSNIVW